jgi:phenylalanyl-tRNA synthetase beta chain
VVDVSNFVLLELGQPLHAFDRAKIQGDISVRFAENNETLTLLDGQSITLKDNSLVIADEQQVLALAGIMGGKSSAVSDDTQDIFLESAFFKPEIIAGRARQYGLHTDSSHRFERGVSPDLQVRAIQRATQLIVEICGGEVGEISEVDQAESLRNRSAIQLRQQRVTRLLGIEIDADLISDMLERLGCIIEINPQGWLVTPPAFRFDMAIEADLIEEIARIYGYDNIPAVLRPFTPRIAVQKEGVVALSRLRDSLVNRAYQEIVSFSFVDAKTEQLLAPEQTQTKLANPLSADLEVMRSTLWSGMLKAVASNLNRQQNRLRFFEVGLSFIAKADGLEQRKKLAGVITGQLYAEQWASNNCAVDFYDLKGDVEVLLAQASQQRFRFEAAQHAALHPGQSAQVVNEQGDVVGYLGALHPKVQKQLGLSQSVFVFELDVGRMQDKKIPAYQQVSKYPSIRRDLALLVDENVATNALYDAIDKVVERESISQLLRYTVFDVYTGEGLEKGKKSIALGLILQDFSRTLEDVEINIYVDLIVKSLFNETGAILR